MAKRNGRTDEELVEQANRGDPGAFEALYERHKAWAAQLALRFTGDHEEAMDVVHDAFIYLLRKLPRLHLSCAFTTLLYPVVKNMALDRLRKSRRMVLDEDIVAHARDPARQLDPERSLAEVVSSLPPLHREVLLMRFVDDMSLEAIAASLGVPLGTVKSRLHYALRALREDPRTSGYFEELR